MSNSEIMQSLKNLIPSIRNTLSSAFGGVMRSRTTTRGIASAVSKSSSINASQDAKNPTAPAHAQKNYRGFSSSTETNARAQAESEKIGQTGGEETRKVEETHEAAEPPKWSNAWWYEKFMQCVVFAITGTTVMRVVRPLMKHVLGLEGSFKEGPNSFRLTYLCVTMPIYSCILITVGTIFGRGPFFRKFAAKMWKRILPKQLRFWERA
eukprot:GDKI01009806.1.p1 GENE.GDKI01009806.1~~GDKI01009806.1.p1  ORF type:complete len:209 (+),score=44.17 GDKI01009806.1:94-720(+)